MGYCTSYTLAWDKHDCDVAINEYIRNSEMHNYALEEDGRCYGSCKWYDHEADMREMSKVFPDAVFDLYGEGEETGDLWHKYFKNGKMQECIGVVEFALYDENLLT
jgi:hypothetical protein